MTCFASIGVSQIQGYLARSRRLWGRRGASDMLAYLTDTSGAADRIEERSFETAGEILQGFPGVTVNDDAVDVDSVLNIRGEDPGEVRKAAEALALNIKLHLPAAHVHTTFREATGYGDVIRAEDDDIPAETRQYPPSMIEFPLAHHCDECSSGMAAEETSVGEETTRLCSDCASRAPRKGRNRLLNWSLLGGVQQGFMVEQVMLRELRKQEKFGHLTQVEHFKELAQLGDLGSEGSRTHTGNHVATIFADGNGFGKLFRELRAAAAESEGGLQELRRVSKAVKDATKQALRKAIEEITDDRVAAANRMPAVPHILGGDDVLVTVPATKALPHHIPETPGTGSGQRHLRTGSGESQFLRGHGDLQTRLPHRRSSGTGHHLAAHRQGSGAGRRLVLCLAGRHQRGPHTVETIPHPRRLGAD